MNNIALLMLILNGNLLFSITFQMSGNKVCLQMMKRSSEKQTKKNIW